MPFLFTGDTSLTYPGYVDEATWHTLQASPGGTYSMVPAGGVNLPVPPGDGRWQDVSEAPAAPPAPPPDPPASSPPAAPPPPVVNPSSSEGEEN